MACLVVQHVVLPQHSRLLPPCARIPCGAGRRVAFSHLSRNAQPPVTLCTVREDDLLPATAAASTRRRRRR